MYESLDGNFKERSDSRSHLLGSQIPFIQGFGVSYFHIRYGTKAWGGDLQNFSLESFWDGHEDAYGVSCQSVFFDYLLLAKFGENPIESYALKLTMGFQQLLAT